MRVLGLFDLIPVSARGEGETAPSPFPYRVDLLDLYELQLGHVRPASGRWHLKVRDVLEHRTGVPMDLALRGAVKAHRADVVLAFLDSRGIFPSWARRHGLPPYANKPLAVISCWWAEELVSGSEDQQTRIKDILDGCSLLFVFSENQREIFAEAGFPSERVIPISFGVDLDFYSPPLEPVTERFQIFSAGVDRGRDFETLVAAAELLPDVEFHIVTKPGRIKTHPANVTLLPMTDMQGHRENLRRSRLVVVPTHDLAYPTGQSVMLEAMACGRPVAVTETQTMTEYLRDGVQVRLPLHDPEGVAKALETAINDSADLDKRALRGREMTVAEFNYELMWGQIAQAMKTLVG